MREIRHQNETRSQYEEVRRHRPKVPWDQLNEDIVFALLGSYEAGVRNGWRAARQPEQSSNGRRALPDSLSCPMGTTPQREALFRAMFHAVIRELVPKNGVEEDMFKGIHQHTVRMAIADLAASLLTYAVDDSDELCKPVWAKLVDEIRDEMRAGILEEIGDVPFPTRQ
jgi:hypothetical protein